MCVGELLRAVSREMNGAVELSILFVGLAFDGFWEVVDVAACVVRDGACRLRRMVSLSLSGGRKRVDVFHWMHAFGIKYPANTGDTFGNDNRYILQATHAHSL